MLSGGSQCLTGRPGIMNGDAVLRWGVRRVCLRVVGPSGGAGRDQMETGGRVFTSGVLPAGIACGQAGTAEVTFATHHSRSLCQCKFSRGRGPPPSHQALASWLAD